MKKGTSKAVALGSPLSKEKPFRGQLGPAGMSTRVLTRISRYEARDLAQWVVIHKDATYRKEAFGHGARLIFDNME